MPVKVNIDRTRLADFCRRNGIARLSFFGSVLRDDFGPKSDLDVLLEFPAGRSPSLFKLGGMQMELTQILSREVDLKTPHFLSSHFRDSVMREAEVQYGA